MEKAFQSKDSLDTLQKPFNTDRVSTLWLHICPYGDVEIVIFSFQAFLPNTSALLVQSRPTQCVCIVLRQGEKNEHCMDNVLRSGSVSRLKVYSRSHLKQPKPSNSQEVRGVLSVQGDQGHPWVRPHREDKLQRTFSSRSWQRWTSAPGTLSYKPRSHVEQGGWVPV